MADRLTQELALAGLLEALTPAVRQAGSLIERLKVEGLTRRLKADKSPVTEADEAAERLLEDAIRALEPDAVIIGEEASSAGFAPDAAPRYWLLDPLDGTRDFVRGGEDYSVNVGLVEDGLPVLGLVLHPPSGTLWTGAPGLGAWKESADHERRAIRSRRLATPPIIVTSRSHLDQRTKDWVAAVADAEVHPSGSSLKFCVVAEGLADAYPRYGPTSEWDTAAADAILRAAGGAMFAAGGAPFTYGRSATRENPSFLAIGDPAAADRLPPFPA